MVLLKFNQITIRYYFAPEKHLKTGLQTISLPWLWRA